MNQGLLDQIRPVTQKLQRVRFWRVLAAIALVTAVAGWLMKEQVDSGQVVGQTLAAVLLVIAFVSAIFAAIACRYSFRNPRTIAQQIEQQFPSLDGRLLTALSQQDEQLGYLQQRVIGEATDHATRHRWTEVVPTGQLALSRLSGLAAFGFLGAILTMLAVSEARLEPDVASRGSSVSRDVQVLPGNAEVERGTSLVVTAKFTGWIPDDAELVCVTSEGSERRYSMTQNLNDPVLGAFVSSVDQSFQYRIESKDWESEPFEISVFEFPSLVRSDANLEYPEYTQLSDKLVEDTVRVSAVEGTDVTWLCYLNKSVQSAELVSKDGTRIPLQKADTSEGAMAATLTLTETQRFTLELTDDAGRKNKYPPELIARMLPNQPPSLKLTAGGDVTVSPLEELPIAATVRDDFGISRFGLSYTFDSDSNELVLGEKLPRGSQSDLEHLVEFEALEAEPDQLFTYYFWAEDFGPDGEVRRTESDMFFAEVRPFEEIFREGESQPGGQQQQQQGQQGQNGQNGEQAMELAELQKEIINATWRVIRDQRPSKLTETFESDVDVIEDSQNTALQQLEELAENVEDERSTTFVDLVRQQMMQARSDLASASEDRDVDDLRSALQAEQGAYAGLLRLRAREFQVMQQRQQQSQSQQQSRSQQRRQQQINELELEQEENRYETQQQAQERTEQEQAEREIRQVLNRLRDLARRQEDLNEELAQLQSALEQAETEEERQEIERQLKRLREQQQDLLREVDELAERMQAPENQEQMSEASEKLEETRENVRQASEALEENDASEALTAGRRAEREFEELRDEFRQQAAGQFNDAVRDMRREAQELDERQEQIAQKLEEIDEPKDTGLRAQNNRQELKQDLQEQRERLGELLEQMQDTVEQSETAEPLLAQKLYDSYRRTQQRQVDQQLSDAAELVERGFDPEARQVEQGASQGLQQLREELEEAASTVLGDETRALERALGELEQLERDLQSELDRNRPNQDQQQQDQQQQDQQQQGQQQQGQQQQGQQQEQQQQGQQQQGQQQEQQQQGQQQQGQQQEQQQQEQQQQEQQQQEQQQQGQQQQGQQQGQQQQGQQQQGQQQQGQQQQGQQQQGQQQQGQQQ
ncbi:MAG: hypothetical protein AAGG48_22505, partial [Planctomycetota bacterium]